MHFESLKGLVEKNRLAHALIFSGPRGAGQTETAKYLAQLLFCRQTKVRPCGECSECHRVTKDSHPDLVWLRPEAGSKGLKVDAVRAVISRANLRPLQAPSKLFVLEEADTLNDTAQNAFLKTLEEPEGHTYFVLISHANEKLLSTVRSRAQEFRFSSVSGLTESDPSLDKARLDITDFLLGRADAPDLSGLEREQVIALLEATVRSLREALLLCSGAGQLLGPLEHRPRLEALSERYRREELTELIETVAEYKEKISQNVNTKLALSVLWEALCPASTI